MNSNLQDCDVDTTAKDKIDEYIKKNELWSDFKLREENWFIPIQSKFLEDIIIG